MRPIKPYVATRNWRWKGRVADSGNVLIRLKRLKVGVLLCRVYRSVNMAFVGSGRVQRGLESP